MLYFDISPNIVIFKGQLKRWDKLTYIARFQNPENGFEGIFEKSVFVLEISAVKVEELCGTNSRFSSFSEKLLSGDFCLCSQYEADLHTEHKDFDSSEPGSQTVNFEVFTEYFVVSLWNFKE